MNVFKKYVPAVMFGLQSALILVWLSNLAATDAYFSVYALIAFGAFACSRYNRSREASCSRGHKLMLYMASVVLSLLVLAANYEIFTLVRDPERIQASTNLMVNLINTFLSFLGGIFVFHPILRWMYENLPVKTLSDPRSDRSREFRLLAIGSFFVIAIINVVHLFLVEYPGNLTEDTFTQISEMAAGSYSNFNTFWHTMFLQAVLSVGYGVFGEANSAVALLCLMQSMILTAAFVYCLMTMYLAGMPKYFLFLSFLIYGILPYNIALSITIWKDVLFAAGGLLMCCALYRILKDLGSRPVWNHIALGIGAVIFGLSRVNGWSVLLGSLLFWAIPLLKKQKKALVILTSVFALCWTLNNPVLGILNVSGGDYTESLSVPLQQVARVITEGCELTQEEVELIEQVLDIEEVPELYTDWLSDPIKVEFRSNNVKFFEENTGAYVKLWLRLGMKYPGEYFKAWVDQTKGYWNGGYNYAMYSETVTDNPYGIAKAGSGNMVAKLFRLYFGLSRHVIFFEPLHSIGLHVWIVSALCLMNLLKKRREWMLAIPAGIVILAMCLATPVYCSFRYAYPLFAVFPLLLGTGLYSKE